MLIRRLATFAVAFAPFVLVGVGERILVPRIGKAMVRPLRVAASAVAVLATAPAARAAEASIATPVLSDTVAAARDIVDHDAHAGMLARAGASPRSRKPKADSIVISAHRLLSLSAERLGAVRWARVVDSHGHATGVRLSGVVALGVGLADGDVVTSIDGRPTLTEGEATAAGAAAWISGAREVHATIVRKNDVIAVVVQLPTRAT